MTPAQQQVPSPSGRYVTVGRGVAAYRAFVPAPLPPDLAFDGELVRALSEADRALGELAGFARTKFPFPLGDWFRARETVLSARIEGLHVDLLDFSASRSQLFPLPDLRPRPAAATVREVEADFWAYVEGRDRLATLPLSLRLIREMHARLFSGIREEGTTPGEFRRSQNWLGAAGATLNEATYVPPPPAELAAALDAFERWLHLDDGYPPLIRLAFMHQHFEAIHPFLDGNGRIGRILIVLLLQVWGLLPRPLLTLSAYFLRHQREYYRLLLAVNEEGSWRDWTIFFLRGIAEEARDALARAQRMLALYDQWSTWANTPRPSVSLTTVINMLFRHGVTAGKTPGGGRRHAERLVEAGFLQRLPDERRGGILIAREIFRVMDES
jgi:Fic family protein